MPWRIAVCPAVRSHRLGTRAFHGPDFWPTTIKPVPGDRHWHFALRRVLARLSGSRTTRLATFPTDCRHMVAILRDGHTALPAGFASLVG